MDEIVVNRLEDFTGVVIGRKIDIFCKSNIGTRNQEKQSSNQDAFKARIGEKYAVIAVADGLGSCELSHVGAKHAVNILCDWVEKDLLGFDEIDKDVSRILCNRVIDRWRSTVGDNYKLYDTTLLFFVYTQKVLLVGGIGDGMVLLKIGEQYRNLSWKDKVFNNQTNSLGSIGAKGDFYVELIRNFSKYDHITAIVATDGISDDIDEKNQKKLIEYINDGIRKRGFEEISTELDQWVNNWKSLYNSDDKTISIIDIKGVDHE